MKKPLLAPDQHEYYLRKVREHLAEKYRDYGKWTDWEKFQSDMLEGLVKL